MRGRRGREEKPSPQHHVYATFFFRPALAFFFVDSGSGWGVKFGSLAIRFRSDKTPKRTSFCRYFVGCNSARHLPRMDGAVIAPMKPVFAQLPPHGLRGAEAAR